MPTAATPTTTATSARPRSDTRCCADEACDDFDRLWSTVPPNDVRPPRIDGSVERRYPSAPVDNHSATTPATANGSHRTRTPRSAASSTIATTSTNGVSG